MKSLRWIVPLLLLPALALVPWACHALRPPRPLDVVVVDRTVAYANRIEHRSLFWLLSQLHVVRADGRPYDAATDYVGTFPGPTPGDPPARSTLLTAEAASADLVYVADTYGVYRDDLLSGAEMKTALERSPRLVGGLELSEAVVLRDAVERGGLAVAEFNTMASPTATAARRVVEETFGVRWSRWIGRYFARLDSREEVPEWLRRVWEREHGADWEFAGPGYVVTRDDAECEVLRVGVEVDDIGLTISRVRPVDPLLAHAADDVGYPFWFEWVTAGPDAETLAEFAWRVSEDGARRLEARGLPASFPAVTRRRSAGGGVAYYLAGDFADNPMPDRPVPFAGYLRLRYHMEGARIAPGETAFYFRFYAPLVTAVLEEAERRNSSAR